jgi:hypothetical protein
MYCSKCGSAVNGNQKYCPSCGEKKRGVLRYVLFGAVPFAVIAVVVVLLFTFGVFSQNQPQVQGQSGGTRIVEGPGYKTPEDAATAYLEALKSGDLDAALATFAVESYAENADLKSYIRLIEQYSPLGHNGMPLPNTGDFVRSLNISALEGYITSGIYRNLMVYAYPTEANKYASTPLDAQSVDDFFSGLEDDTKLRELATLEIKRMLSQSELNSRLRGTIYSSETVANNRESTLAVTGADEIADVAAFLDIAGTEYLFVNSAVKYADGMWRLKGGGSLGLVLRISQLYNTGGIVPIDDSAIMDDELLELLR